MGQSFVAPPNVPSDAVKILRDGFDATMKDPEFLATMKKGNLEINPMNGVDLTDIVMKTVGAPKEVINGYQAAITAAQ
jgi:tripartite-type tricarboxylate transporter receptor subunit TctC